MLSFPSKFKTSIFIRVLLNCFSNNCFTWLLQYLLIRKVSHLIYYNPIKIVSKISDQNTCLWQRNPDNRRPWKRPLKTQLTSLDSYFPSLHASKIRNNAHLITFGFKVILIDVFKDLITIIKTIIFIVTVNNNFLFLAVSCLTCLH